LTLNGLGEISKALGDCCLGSHLYFDNHRLMWPTSYEIRAKARQEGGPFLWRRFDQHVVSAGFVLSRDVLKFLPVGFSI